jgi:hypothetical protein
MFRKLILVIILINLITLNSSEQDNNDDDLYRAFNEEQEKFISMFDKSNNNNEVAIKGSDGYQQEESYGADEDEGEEKSNENFNRFMQAIRDRSQFNAESAEAKKNGLK